MIESFVQYQEQGMLLFQQLAFLAVPLLGMAFTKKQKDYIKERDNKKCQGNNASMRGKDKGRLEVHHILPQAVGYKLGLTRDEIDTSENAIILCQGHHVGGGKGDVVHDDQSEYVERYRSGDKKAFEEMQRDRKAKVDKGEPYWNQQFDNNFNKLAKSNQSRMEKFKGKFFPKRKKK